MTDLEKLSDDMKRSTNNCGDWFESHVVQEWIDRIDMEVVRQQKKRSPNPPPPPEDIGGIYKSGLPVGGGLLVMMIVGLAAVVACIISVGLPP